MPTPGLAQRVAAIRAGIEEHQARRGWTHPVTIVAVTKTHGVDAVQTAYDAGLRVVGENRVQEALAKQEAAAHIPVEWHLIGSLQRNKAKHVVGRFALIHSIDREDLAVELQRRIPVGQVQPILVQVNCSSEPQKGGVEPGELVALLATLRGLDRLAVRGLMTMAELTEDQERQRAAFVRLRSLRDEAVAAGFELPELSMGMSGDYLVAVEEGATMVRLGTLLFGERAT